MTMTPWLLLDYGDVISLPYDEEVGAEVARLLDLAPEELMERYWVNRVHLDSGLPTAPYWSGVAGRDVTEDEAAKLDAVDLNGWARTNAEVLALVEEQRAAGVRLALLSNAPHVQADAFEQVAWAVGFERIFVSARLGLVKPDPAIFQHVLDELGAPADEVTFVDDRAANVEAAASLGIRALLFTGVDDLRVALGHPAG
ncbi:MAG: HAD family phosphatase [Marmoricola sp.]|nr:HAD family phosphatase [Marmoricola sp.]